MGDSHEVRPLVYRPGQARKILGIGQTKFFALVKSGDLRTKKMGRATLVEDSEIKRFLAALPAGGNR